GRTDFERNPPLADERHDAWIAEKCETVPDALGPEQLDRHADALGPNSFAGVRGHVQTQVTSLAINVSEEFGGAARFIAPDSKSHDAPRAKAARPIEDLPRVIRPELADGIKNPLNAHSQPPLGLARGGGDRLEDRLNRLLLPEDDAGGQRDLGILDVLLRQPLDEARGHERVVLRRLEHQRHQGERSQESLKAAVTVRVPLALADPVLNFLPQPALVLGELAQGDRPDAALEVEVKFHFRQPS